VLAPCSPFSVSGELMRESAALARHYGVQLHTHLAETEDEVDFTIQQFGKRPVAYMEEVDWLGPDVWFAHSVYLDKSEIGVYADHGCGVAHCPSSNMRLASGAAPILDLVSAGVDVGIGVDGSASNDGSHLLEETRQAMLLSRLRAGMLGASRSGGNDQPIMSARQALELATRGGAAVLGRTDIGSLQPGKAGDFTAIDLNKIDYAGALHDPVAALVFCAPVKADYTVVGGKFVVKEGRLQTLDLPVHIERHNAAAARLLNG
jgi:8-oxoguanine deaminase